MRIDCDLSGRAGWEGGQGDLVGIISYTHQISHSQRERERRSPTWPTSVTFVTLAPALNAWRYGLQQRPLTLGCNNALPLERLFRLFQLLLAFLREIF